MTDYVALDASKNIAITAHVAGADAMKSMNRLVHEFIARDLGGITYGA